MHSFTYGNCEAIYTYQKLILDNMTILLSLLIHFNFVWVFWHYVATYDIRILFFGPPAVARRVLWIRICPSFCPSVRKFSWDWLISFFLKLSMVLGTYVLLCVTEPHSLDPPPHFLKSGGGVNFNYLSQRRGFWKTKKRGGSMVQRQVFIKGGGGLARFLFNFFTIYYFYI